MRDYAPRKVNCPLCGDVLRPPNDAVGDIWEIEGCEACRDRHNRRARAILSKAGLLAN
ncbi:MAG: hypothetical protein HYX93_01870 [Chloroflexi bacterium]|nr:hypothetical protein [Chloroflexota bacterium]